MAARTRLNTMIHSVVLVVAVLAAAMPVAANSAATPPMLWPAAGRPAIVTPGGTFSLGLHKGETAQLVGAGQTVSLTLDATRTVHGVERAEAVVPDNIAPGVYALRTDRDGTAATRDGAVHVVDAIPEEYSFAFLRGRAFTEETTEESQALVRSHLLESGAALAFLVGPLFEQQSEAACAELQQTLAAIPMPVFVCPGPDEGTSPAYRATFGESVYGTTYGQDGFLLLGSGFPASEPASNQALGPAYLARRELRPSRWSTGVTSHYSLDWLPRGQMVLFADDPLDYLLAGTVQEGLGNAVPWGRTRIIPPPAIPRGSLLVFDVTNSGIRLRQELQAPEQPPEQAEE